MEKSNFNLEQFKNGKKAKTKYGQTAKFIMISRNRLIVAYQPLTGNVSQEIYQLDGRKYPNTSHPFDLVEMV